jgi:hypothetical protein
MQDRPTAPELLDAMAADLYSEVREWVPRERRFRVLVLANLCAVLARELRAGEEPSRRDLELFTALSGSPADDPREAATTLAAAIRHGDLDETLPEAIAALREHVARKLEVARPGYAVSAGDG